MKYILSLSLLWVQFFSYTQDFFYKNYDWKEVPENFVLSPDESKLDEVIVKYKKTIHLVQSEQQLLEYHLTHKIIKLNTDKGIEKNNKYYVGNRGSINVEIQKARVITPSGKIINLSKSDIIDSKDENGNVNYQYFAFEGLEIGSVIEYLDVIIFPPNLDGAVLNVQGEVLKKNVEIDIITPKHIEYLTHPINGLKQFTKDSLSFFNQRIFLNLEQVEPLEEEKWSTWDANIQKMYYKFNKNTNTKKANFYTYSNISNDIYTRYFPELSKKQKSEIQKLLLKSGMKNQKSLEDKIRVFENFIKKEIVVIDEYFENSEDISLIISKKITTRNGFYKLFINCLKESDIAFEFIITCDKYEDKFITEYEAYNFLREYLIYIKDLDKYLSHSITSRLGFVPENIINTKGLFISEVKIGDLYTGVGKIKFIKGTISDQSIDIINTKTTFGNEMENAIVEIERITSGYKAQAYQSYIDLLDNEQRTELINDYIAYIDNETKVDNIVVENDSSDLYGFKPLIGRGTMKSENFIEKGGENYLFKVGMLIGPQAELYNSKKRVSQVETGAPRKYQRKIEVEIPAGFEIKNIESLVIDVQPDKTNSSLGFTSNYKMEGNKLTVTISEWYNNFNYTVEEYLYYEKVMNTAADFNKIVLILQRKK